MSKFLLGVGAFLLFLSLAHGEPTPFDRKFNELQRDMRTEQVKSLLGPPDLREVKDEKEIWHYNSGDGRRVVFVNGKLAEFAIDQKAQLSAVPAPTPTPIPPPVDLEIGADCKSDNECKLKNCHFHQCAGRNNCTVPVGKVCATDAQCCSGNCDFQICKKR